jgi:hypothetical protein
VFCVPKNRDGACFTFRQLLEAEYGNIIEDPDDPDPLTAKLIERAEQMMEEKEVDASNEKPITDTEIKKYNDNVVSDIAEQVQQAMMQQDSESKSESVENNEVSLNDESSSSSDDVVKAEDKPVEKKNRFSSLLKKTGGKSFGNDFGKQFN